MSKNLKITRGTDKQLQRIEAKLKASAEKKLRAIRRGDKGFTLSLLSSAR